MLLHEYQAKSLLQRFKIPSPIYYLIESEEDITRVLQTTELQSGVIKAQVHAGGRGKAGGVRIVQNSQEELYNVAKEMLSMTLITNQTGKDGVKVQKIILTPLVDIERELYLAVLFDRKMGCHKVVASRSGGVEIEEVAKKHPQTIFHEVISEKNTLHRFQIHRLMNRLGIEKSLQDSFIKIIDNLLVAYFHSDAILLEINPFVITEQKTFLALDAKMSIDDNALFRNPGLKNLFDDTQVSTREKKAHLLDLAYVPLKGSVGCIVNGAGLAMATLDLLHFWGGSPANFLDVGGGATEEKVSEGFRIVVSDPNVRVVFVNIFGGIMNCETIAKAIVSSVHEHKKNKTSNAVLPHIVVRMEGTNVEGARLYLEKAKLSQVEIVTSLDAAARRAVLLAQV